MEVCKSKEDAIGIKFLDNKTISLINNSIVEIIPEKCTSIDIDIKDGKALFKDLEIPLHLRDSKLNYLRLLYILKGETSHEIFYFKKSVEIHVDTKLKDVEIGNETIKFSRFCGNYGLLLPHYCIGNETFAIFGKKKEDVITAFNEFLQLLDIFRKVLLELS